MLSQVEYLCKVQLTFSNLNHILLKFYIHTLPFEAICISYTNQTYMYFPRVYVIRDMMHLHNTHSSLTHFKINILKNKRQLLVHYGITMHQHHNVCLLEYSDELYATTQQKDRFKLPFSVVFQHILNENAN